MAKMIIGRPLPRDCEVSNSQGLGPEYCFFWDWSHAPMDQAHTMRPGLEECRAYINTLLTCLQIVTRGKPSSGFQTE
jgi:hypothetical protein